jgi:hypothetical protein
MVVGARSFKFGRPCTVLAHILILRRELSQRPSSDGEPEKIENKEIQFINVLELCCVLYLVWTAR